MDKPLLFIKRAPGRCRWFERESHAWQGLKSEKVVAPAWSREFRASPRFKNVGGTPSLHAMPMSVPEPNSEIRCGKLAGGLMSVLGIGFYAS